MKNNLVGSHNLRHQGPGQLPSNALAAIRRLGYDAAQVAALPGASKRTFFGVGNPHRVGPVAPGERVLEAACGGGFDLLLTAQRLAPRGACVGVEDHDELRALATQSVVEAGLNARIEVVKGTPDRLPAASRTFDAVFSHGTLCRVGSAGALLREVARVLKPGGRLHLAELVVSVATGSPADRAGFPPSEEELIALMHQSGLRRAQLVERFEPPEHLPEAGHPWSLGEAQRAKIRQALRAGAIGATFLARK